jgi:hypothetical protein
LKKLFLSLAPVLVFSQSRPAITVTPSQPVVTAGSSITISANQNVSFSLAGGGSLTAGPGPNTIIYKAPATFQPPQHVLHGCMVTPDDSIYNTRIDSLPLAKNSAQWVAGTLLGPLTLDFVWGTNLVDDSFPLMTQSFHYTTLLNNVGFPIPALPEKKRENGAYTTNDSADHHMVVLNHQSCQFYETYQQGVVLPSCPLCTAGSGLTFNSVSYAQPSQAYGGGSTDAAALPLTALTVHLSEIQAGVIKHALRFTACAGCISDQFVWPASQSTGAAPSAPPMGSRFRLKASFDVSGFPAPAQVVLTALKQYGMILADIGTSGHASVSSDVTEDPDVARALQQIGFSSIDYSNFEVVDESSLMLNVSSSAVNPRNPYVHPVNQAVLTIASLSDPTNFVTLPIALKSVTVGTPDPAIVVQAGTQTFPVQFWVNGTANQEVVWSISSPAAGAIDANGNYTAPTTVDSVVQATLTAQSVADPTASASVALSIFPQGYIHIDSGSAVSTVDELGYTWIPDMGFETGSFMEYNDNYPSNAWGKISNPIQTKSYMFTWGDDIHYRMHVPNGRYRVTFLFGAGDCTGNFNSVTRGPIHLESQGNIVIQNWSLSAATHDTCRTPASVTIPATVTDTNLSLALRSVTTNDVQSAPIVNGLKMARYNAAPYYTIDAQQQKAIRVGNSIQLKPISWFAPSGPVNWSVVAGPGSISQSGVYTAPGAIAAQGVPVTIQVASLNGRVTGQVQLMVTQ